MWELPHLLRPPGQGCYGSVTRGWMCSGDSSSKHGPRRLERGQTASEGDSRSGSSES